MMNRQLHDHLNRVTIKGNDYLYDLDIQGNDGIINNTVRWGTAKEGIYRMCKGFPTWDDEELRFHVETVKEVKPDHSAVYHLTKRLINSCLSYAEGLSLSGDEIYDIVYNAGVGISCLDDTFTINEPAMRWLNSDCLKVRKGMKLNRAVTKALQKLEYGSSKAYVDTWIQTYNNEVGEYMQSKSIPEKWYVSINPLDYLSMSDGNGWRSCHWIEDGCYRAGCFSYMNDETTVIIYKESEEGRTVKQERFCGWVTAETFGIITKSYPTGSNEETANKLLSSLRELFPDMTNDGIVKVRSNNGNKAYPDYHHYEVFCISKLEEPTQIQAGGYAYSIDEDEPIDDGEYLTNGNSFCCADCGARLYDGDNAIWVDGEVYCSSCVTYCNICEDYHREGDCSEYYTNGYNGRRYIRYACADCWDANIVTCDECGEDWHMDDVVYIDEDTATDDRLEGYYCPYCLEQ